MTEPADLVDVLLADHRAMLELLDELDAADTAEDCKALYLRLAAELAAHEAVEHQLVFSAVWDLCGGAGGDVRTEADAGARIGEHEEMNGLIAEMQSLDPEGFRFTTRASALAVELRDHFESEETTLFPWLRSMIGRDRLVELAEAAPAVRAHAAAFPPVDVAG
jgi:hypothetical protein